MVKWVERWALSELLERQRRIIWRRPLFRLPTGRGRESSQSKSTGTTGTASAQIQREEVFSKGVDSTCGSQVPPLASVSGLIPAAVAWWP